MNTRFAQYWTRWKDNSLLKADDLITTIPISTHCIIHQRMSIPVTKQSMHFAVIQKIIRAKSLMWDNDGDDSGDMRRGLAGGGVARSPLRAGCRDQTEGNLSCTVAASLHPRTQPAHSHVHTPVIFARGRACTMVRDERVTVCVSHSLSPSFIPLPVILLPPYFVPSPNPSHPISISVFSFLSHSFPLTYTCTCAPSSRPRTQLARPRPWHRRSLTWGLCKEILKSVRYHCLMVSPWQLREQGPALQCQTRRILSLSKGISAVCRWWDVVIKEQHIKYILYRGFWISIHPKVGFMQNI